MHCFSREHTLERFAASVARMRALCPQVECVAVSSSAVSFRFHGLEFARAALEPDRHFRISERVVFGAPPAEYEWNDETEPLLKQLIERLLLKRVGRDHVHPFYRLQPERWLQSVVERDLALIDARLDPSIFYSQVPAFAASDRAVIDLLGITRDGRLAVIELKAAEDFHLPIQGLDYWARVRQHHRRGDFQRSGYFHGRTSPSAIPSSSSPRPHCTCILPRQPCCVTFHLSWTGRWPRSTSAGATESASSSASRRNSCRDSPRSRSMIPSILFIAGPSPCRSAPAGSPRLFRSCAG